MIAIPAIDLRGGACVQLVGGSFDDERIRIADPLDVLARWEAAGFRRLHVVDLDAAVEAGDNRASIDALLAASSCAMQVGGGVRSAERIGELLAAGAECVVVGTRAIEDLEWLSDVAARNPGRLIVAADVRERRVVTRGWTIDTSLDIGDAMDRLRAFPLGGVLVTAVHVEGRMTGPDVALIDAVVERAAWPVIASGGIGSAADLRALQQTGVAAAVVGMALYTGALDARRTAEEFAQ